MIFRPILRAFLLPCLVASFSFLPALSQSVTVSAASLTYENQAQGTSSSVHKVTLTNGQTSAITLSSISTNLADYFETNNCPLSPATLAAGATCTISITFTPSAQGTRDATLTVVDAGLSNPQLITLNGKGTGPILESISVTPVTASVIVADTQQFTATGTYSDGSTKNLTTTANWTSSSASTATVGGHTGLAKGVAAGTATITATSAKISGSATLTVSAAVLTSIAVTPSTPSVAAGKTQQFTATGTYNNGTTKNLTSTATWTSSTTSIATVSSSGLATTIAQGSATITATSGTISGSATLTVTAAVLTSMAVTPSTASIGVSSTQQFTATGTYSNGTTQNLTTTASWTSSATSIATIKIHTGVATGVSAGTATISASLGTVHGTATLTVTTAVLTSISVTPSPASVAAGNTQQFTATGNYSNGNHAELDYNRNVDIVEPFGCNRSQWRLVHSDRTGNNDDYGLVRHYQRIGNAHCHSSCIDFDFDYPREHIDREGDGSAICGHRKLQRWQHAGPDEHRHLEFVADLCGHGYRRRSCHRHRRRRVDDQRHVRNDYWDCGDQCCSSRSGLHRRDACEPFVCLGHNIAIDGHRYLQRWEHSQHNELGHLGQCQYECRYCQRSRHHHQHSFGQRQYYRYVGHNYWLDHSYGHSCDTHFDRGDPRYSDYSAWGKPTVHGNGNFHRWQHAKHNRYGGVELRHADCGDHHHGGLSHRPGARRCNDHS
jgi:uncharacterized protein YjdB